MKSAITILAVAAAAAFIVATQWMIVVGCDSFVVVDNHKVFRYGFPFRIVACGQELPFRTPAGQIPWRVTGNFAFFFVGGLAVVGLVRRRVRSRTE